VVRGFTVLGNYCQIFNLANNKQPAAMVGLSMPFRLTNDKHVLCVCMASTDVL